MNILSVGAVCACDVTSPSPFYVTQKKPLLLFLDRLCTVWEETNETLFWPFPILFLYNTTDILSFLPFNPFSCVSIKERQTTKSFATTHWWRMMMAARCLFLFLVELFFVFCYPGTPGSFFYYYYLTTTTTEIVFFFFFAKFKKKKKKTSKSSH